MKTRAFIICVAGILVLAIGAAVAQQNVPEVIEFDGAADEGVSKEIY